VTGGFRGPAIADSAERVIANAAERLSADSADYADSIFQRHVHDLAIGSGVRAARRIPRNLIRRFRVTVISGFRGLRGFIISGGHRHACWLARHRSAANSAERHPQIAPNGISGFRGLRGFIFQSSS
jgi:hypothetical protein